MINGICGLCGNQTPSLDSHHWIEKGEVRYVRICASCNTNLGRLFGKNYPNWDEQVGRMHKYFADTNEFCKKVGLLLSYSRVPPIPFKSIVQPEPTKYQGDSEYLVSVLGWTGRVKAVSYSAARSLALRLFIKEAGSEFPSSKLCCLATVSKVGTAKSRPGVRSPRVGTRRGRQAEFAVLDGV